LIQQDTTFFVGGSCMVNHQGLSIGVVDASGVGGTMFLFPQLRIHVQSRRVKSQGGKGFWIALYSLMQSCTISVTRNAEAQSTVHIVPTVLSDHAPLPHYAWESGGVSLWLGIDMYRKWLEPRKGQTTTPSPRIFPRCSLGVARRMGPGQFR